MPETTTRPSGLVLTKTDDQTIAWQYPPSGPNAKGTIRRSPNASDSWSVSNAGNIRPGRSIVSAPHVKLERAISILEREIEAKKREKQEEAAELQRKKDEEEAKARQFAEEEQRLKEYMDDLFK